MLKRDNDDVDDGADDGAHEENPDIRPPPYPLMDYIYLGKLKVSTFDQLLELLLVSDKLGFEVLNPPVVL